MELRCGGTVVWRIIFLLFCKWIIMACCAVPNEYEYNKYDKQNQFSFKFSSSLLATIINATVRTVQWVARLRLIGFKSFGNPTDPISQHIFIFIYNAKFHSLVCCSFKYHPLKHPTSIIKFAKHHRIRIAAIEYLQNMAFKLIKLEFSSDF